MSKSPASVECVQTTLDLVLRGSSSLIDPELENIKTRIQNVCIDLGGISKTFSQQREILVERINEAVDKQSEISRQDVYDLLLGGIDFQYLKAISDQVHDLLHHLMEVLKQYDGDRESYRVEAAKNFKDFFHRLNIDSTGQPNEITKELIGKPLSEWPQELAKQAQEVWEEVGQFLEYERRNAGSEEDRAAIHELVEDFRLGNINVDYKDRKVEQVKQLAGAVQLVSQAGITISQTILNLKE